MKLNRIDLRALLRKLLFGKPGEGKIHVVATQQRCSPTATRSSCNSPLLSVTAIRREVGSAAADIDDQNQIARLDLFAPIGISLDPGIERSLRLFEHDYFRIAG